MFSGFAGEPGTTIAERSRERQGESVMNDVAIRTQGLHKNFGQLQAVRGIDLCVPAGEIFSLLGPNGAGKSTTISMLACLLRPSGGDAWIMGHSVIHEPMAVKRLIGVVPQEIALYADLSARENLTFWGRMYGLRGAALSRRADEVLETIGLQERQREPVGRFSGGMKRRVNIGIALMHRPQLLILDEPTVGIDPQSRRHILDSVRELNRAGMTVLYTTHYMEEAQELSNHIAIMDQGQLIAQGTHAELVHIVGELDRVDLTVSGSAPEALQRWQGIPGVRRISTDHEHVTAPAGALSAMGNGHAAPNPDHVTLLVDDSDQVLPLLFDSVAATSAHITSVSVQEPNLEAVFLHLTGRALRDD
jgi:ABC-2 type transport system ATP-binding protein